MGFLWDLFFWVAIGIHVMGIFHDIFMGHVMGDIIWDM